MTPNPVLTLPQILRAALATGPRTRRDLERAAALKGFSSVQVEMLLSKAERAGDLICEPMYRPVTREERATQPLGRTPEPQLRRLRAVK